MAGGAKTGRSTGRLGAAMALAGAVAVAAPAQADQNVWDFVADSHRAAQADAREAAGAGEAAREAMRQRPAGAPRTVLPTHLWDHVLAAATPAATRLAALIRNPPARTKPPAKTPGSTRPTPPALAAMPRPNPHPETSTHAAACGPDAIGPSRAVSLDTAGGPHFGRHDRYGVPTFLGPKEVVLTFDDGPRPKTTRRILKTLEEHCVKATFFVIGRAARWQPEILRETAAAGHTIAGHTATHPIPFNRQGHRVSMREIDRGFDMVEDALGAPIAPFFRFPGLAYTRAMLDELSARDVSAFSVDVISDDTAADATPALIVKRTMARLKRYGNGILLFHDTLNRTAAALPVLLKQLKAEGYRVVHMRSVRPYRAPTPPLPGGTTLVASAPAVSGTQSSADPTASLASSRSAAPNRAPTHAPAAFVTADTRKPAPKPAFRRPEKVSFEAPSIAAIY